jgi:hypothetical protein
VADSSTAPGPSRGQLFVINLVGVVGLVFGVVPVLKYLLDLDFAAFTTAPYDWLELEGAARLLPPVMVLVVCGLLAWWLERRTQSSPDP